MAEDMTLSLTDQIYQQLVDGLKTGDLDWTHFIAKHSASKGPLYNAVGRFFKDMESKVREVGEVQSKFDAAGLKLDSLDQKIEAAESSLVPLDERRKVLNEQIETLETKLTEKSNLLEHARELGKIGFDIERLRQLREALTETGAKSGLTGKEAVAKFFGDLKDYETLLEARALLEGLHTQIETKKLQAEKWQAEEEAARRKHDDLKEAIGTTDSLLKRGVKAEQIVSWNGIVSKLGGPEELEKELDNYRTMRETLNVRKEEVAACQLKLTQVQSQVNTMEEERAKIEAGIEALKVVGLKELKAMTDEAAKQLKVVAAGEIGEAQAVGQEIRKVFANYFVQLDKLLEKAIHLGEELERTKQELQRYEGVKNILESHAVAMEEAK